MQKEYEAPELIEITSLGKSDPGLPTTTSGVSWFNSHTIDPGGVE